MPDSHPIALRQRVVDAYENGEGTYADIAERFVIGVASVSRWLRLHRYSGDVAPKPLGGGPRREIPPEIREHVLKLVREEPNWTTTELSEQVAEDFDVIINRKRIGLLLHDAGFTFKRGSPDRQLPGSHTQSRNESPSSVPKKTWTLPG